MAVDEARKALLAYLADMAALKPQVGTEDDAAFVEAFKRAREKAKLAAQDYVRAIDATRPD